MREIPQYKGKNEGIQILRALACAFVVWCHTDIGDGIGAFGVDIFIVICGFMLMYSTSNTTDGFLLKRIKKIVPLYWFMTIVTSVLVVIMPSLFRSYEFSPVYLLKSLFFIPYEHSGILQPIYGLGWTLNYEMMMYLVFWVSMKISYKYRALISSIILLSTMLFSNCVSNFYVEYYGNSLIVEFIFGMLAFYFVKSKYGDVVRKLIKKLATLSEVGAFICIIATFYLLCTVKITQASRGIVWGIPALILLLLFYYIYECGLYKKQLQWLVEIGNGSYYIYMTHIYVVRGVETIVSRAVKINMIFVDVFSVIVACSIGYIWVVWIKKLKQRGNS